MRPRILQTMGPARPACWRVLALIAACAFAAASGFAQVPETPAGGAAATTDAAPAPPALDTLARTRKHVQEYFDQFSNLTCKETVTQLVLNGSGRTLYRENSAYDYQFETSDQNGAWKFTETRASRNTAFRDPARTLLVTSGFASLLLVAHPMYEASYTFESDGSETIGGISYQRIRFMPIAGTPSPATLRLRGKNYPLPLSGTLWIDPQSGGIVKLEAKVESGLTDIGLAGMRSEVYFAQHQFKGLQHAVWVPESATIDVQTPRQHWRNLHRFTDYKRFDVDVHEEIGKEQ
ncbi:MAG: hypothetical protein LAO08_18950 [Acidobacteriia bacterium]|nr:hypothetical protein [Terriglobia bacterium]